MAQFYYKMGGGTIPKKDNHYKEEKIVENDSDNSVLEPQSLNAKLL